MAKRQSPDSPLIDEVTPAAAIPGGEFQIKGKRLAKDSRPIVQVGGVSAPLVIGSNTFAVARVPENAGDGELTVFGGGANKASWPCAVGIQLADGLHPVANPAVDRAGNVFCCFSGSRGQKTPVSVYKIDRQSNMRPFLTEVMNATSLAFDGEGFLYVSSRHEGTVSRATPEGEVSTFVEGMGVATGLAFDAEGNLYVGDRSGTIFKISAQRQIYVFATLEQSIAAYHLAMGPDGFLYVTGPTTSSFDAVHRIAPNGEVEVFYRGLGRPQGSAHDVDGNFYVASSLAGRRGIVRIDGDRKAELYLSGPNIVGLAFTPTKQMIVATTSALYRVEANLAGYSAT